MTALRPIFGRAKDSEITQDVELPKQAAPEGAAVTSDAIACRKKSVLQIIEGQRSRLHRQKNMKSMPA